MKTLLGIFIIGSLVMISSCNKEEENPFDEFIGQTSNPPAENIPTDNFAYLHQKIFRPTCANSGCHDGSFEPDFRTIGSAYNSLVYHPGISNDLSNTYTYRVLPGDANLSLLYARMTIFLPNSSGVMPLELDTGSDWLSNEAQYIQAVADWIDGGAKDMFGNAPGLGNLEPQVTGFLAFPDNNTSTAFVRAAGAGVQPIEVPAQNIDIWFSIEDDSTANTAIAYNKVKVSTEAFDFSGVPEVDMTLGSSIIAEDFTGSPVPFDRKVDLELSGYPVGTYLYVRAYLDDGDHSNPTEIPNDGTSSPMRDYFTLRIVP